MCVFMQLLQFKFYSLPWCVSHACGIFIELKGEKIVQQWWVYLAEKMFISTHLSLTCSSFHSDLAWHWTVPVSYITALKHKQHGLLLSDCIKTMCAVLYYSICNMKSSFTYTSSRFIATYQSIN